MAKRPRQHGFAAFAPEDVADARAGRPPGDLREYGASRGLAWLDRARPLGFSAGSPGFDEYRFSVLRGDLPGGRYGVLMHQLMEIPVTKSPNVSGKLYGSVVKSGGSWWSFSLPNRTDIPIVGDFLDPPTDHSPREPFDTNAVWIPTTAVGTHVPESVLPLFLTRLDRRDKLSPYDFDQRRDLGSAGLPDWRLRTHGTPVSDALLHRLLTPSVREVLTRRANDPYFGVLLLRGTMVVRRNGFVLDPDELDRLAADMCTIADAVRDACLPELAPRPLTEPLPSPRSEHPEVTPAWRDGYIQVATRLGLAMEDPDELHRAFPALPLPGRVVAAMYGDLGGGVQGRLVYAAEMNLRAAERARGAVLLTAQPGTPDTPPAGERQDDRLLIHHQRSGMHVLVSAQTAGFYREEQEGLLDRALAFARERGLVRR
ncbi:hypothetical protein [Nocardioides bizhenqiangii]|uniref:Uncharacterized protein n=1 Tax=Nocardioides bizhenqiangii TaxID=3095076 RepID=A0ABZ0ZLY6_9ACTN|nr:hypothetical protein [Nocardioides sp. HM61]WQQ24739.1 hypothetical protein SHK19_12255 [Nocardioides sp. HM61]